MKELKGNLIRDKILSSLKRPMQFSELKKAIEVSSFGTLTYHLKLLLKDGKIKKKKELKKQGRPTLYFLSTLKNVPNTIEEALKIWDTKEELKELKCLKTINKKPREDNFFNDIRGGLTDPSRALVDAGLTKIIHVITPKGEQFLKDNQTLTSKNLLKQ